MKKILIFIIVLVSLFCVSFAAERDVSVILDGQDVVFPDQQPVLQDARVLVPVRGVFEAMGAEVTYIPRTDFVEEGVRITKADTEISFEIGSVKVKVTNDGNPQTKEIDVATRIINDRTMIPIRFVSETMGYRVEWIDEKSTVEIFSEWNTEADTAEKIQLENRVSLGKNNGMLIKDDGTVWAWGTGEYGQLCGIEESEVPVKIRGISNAVAVGCGGKSMYVLKSDGTVWSWGNNAGGELGRETAGKLDSTPKKIEGLENVVEIAAGYDFALALDKEGRVWSWGINRCGQLGMGDTVNRTAPEQVNTISGKVVSVAAGNQHGAAITSDQRVWLWGSNDGSQLGKTDKNSRIETPFMLKSITRLTEVAAGGGQTIALRPDGSIYMWGTTYIGEMSEEEKAELEKGEQEEAEDTENTENTEEPEAVAVVDEDGYCRYLEPQRMRYIYYDMDKDADFIQILTKANMISCGDYHSLALVNGKIYAWGDSALMPRRVVDRSWRFYAQEYNGLDNVQGVYAAKEQDIYALTSDGILWQITTAGKKEFFTM